MQLPFASIPILPAEKEKNFFDLAQILGPLPKAWPGGAACSVDRSGEEDSQNRPFSDTPPRRLLHNPTPLLDLCQNLCQNQRVKTINLSRVSDTNSRDSIQP